MCKILLKGRPARFVYVHKNDVTVNDSILSIKGIPYSRALPLPISSLKLSSDPSSATFAACNDSLFVEPCVHARAIAINTLFALALDECQVCILIII